MTVVETGVSDSRVFRVLTGDGCSGPGCSVYRRNSGLQLESKEDRRTPVRNLVVEHRRTPSRPSWVPQSRYGQESSSRLTSYGSRLPVTLEGPVTIDVPSTTPHPWQDYALADTVPRLGVSRHERSFRRGSDGWGVVGEYLLTPGEEWGVRRNPTKTFPCPVREITRGNKAPRTRKCQFTQVL